MASNWKIHTKDRKFTFFNDDLERQSTEPFYFIQGADTQLGLKDVYENRKTDIPPPTGRYWLEEMELARRAVKCINNLKPRPSFVVICGDLCNAYPVTDPEMRAMQEEDFKEIMSKIDPSIPLVCVCGNHDVGNQPTPQGVALYNSSFGDDFFSFWRGGILFIVLNSQFYFDPSEVPKIHATQESWLDSVLQEGKNRAARIIVFQHIPWFIDHVDEPDQYFNLPSIIRKTTLDKLVAAGVSHVFCGHLHYNAEGTYRSIELVTTSAVGYQLGKDTHGMRIVKIKEKSVEHAYHSLEDFPTEVTL